MCFSTGFPVFVGWGPQLTMIYNDGYAAMLGSGKHPGAMGRPLREVWEEVWPDIGPLVANVMATGEPYLGTDLPLRVERSGFLEETTFTFSYSALRDGDDVVRGLLDIAVETTDAVVASRRFQTLGALSTSLNAAKLDVDRCIAVAIDVLRTSPDIARADIYRYTRGDAVTLLASTHGVGDGAVPTSAVQAVCGSGRAMRSGDVLIEPLPRARDEAPGGAIALWGNAGRPDDAGQRLFLHLVAASLGNALSAALAHHRQVDDVQAVSSALQTAMLPPDPGSPTWHTRYRPADHRLAVGGDWYDVVALRDGRFGLVVGDCVGHGLEAAAVMGQLRSAARALLLQDLGPAATLDGLDRFALTLPGAECASVVCAIVDDASCTITYSVAGHPPPLVLGEDGGRWLDEGHGSLLGLGLGPRPEASAPFEAGETLLLYTDGLVERRGEALSVGLARLLRAAGEADGALVTTALGDHLITTLLAHGAGDDVALVVYRSLGAEGRSVSARR